MELAYIVTSNQYAGDDVGVLPVFLVQHRLELKGFRNRVGLVVAICMWVMVWWNVSELFSLKISTQDEKKN